MPVSRVEKYKPARLVTSETASLKASVSGAGIPWAGHATAATAGAGAAQWFTINGFKLQFYSDGTYWRPANGRALIYQQLGTIASPLASIAGNGAVQPIALPTPCLIPAGLLFPGAVLSFTSRITKTTVETGSFFLQLASTVGGLTNTSLQVSAFLSAAAGNPSTANITQELAVLAGGVLQYTTTFSDLTVAASSTQMTERTDAGALTADRWLIPTISGFATATVGVTRLSVELRG